MSARRHINNPLGLPGKEKLMEAIQGKPPGRKVRLFDLLRALADRQEAFDDTRNSDVGSTGRYVAKGV